MTGEAHAKRLALCFWEGYLGVAPSLIAGIETLAAQGYEVDVVLRDPAGSFPPPPTFDAELVRIIALRPLRPAGTHISWAESDLSTRVRLIPNKFLNWMFEHLDRLRFLMLCRRLAKQKRYDAVIGVDDDGVVAAGGIAARHCIPLLFWSLELDPHAGRRDPVLRLVRWLALRYRRIANVTIVQDKQRARALGSPHGAADVSIRLVPNAPAGPAVDHRSRFFHGRFNLPPEQRVVLHAGGISPQMMLEAVARAAATWPADWRLVLHERERRSPDSPYLQQVKEAGRGRVLLSLDPVPYRELDDIFASADISLVLYSNEYGDNVRLIARASGKLAHSLRAGIPVVCSDLPGLSSLVEDYGCGVVIKAIGEIEDAVRLILADHQRYRERAWACYRESLEFGRQFSVVLDDLRRLTGKAERTCIHGTR